MLHHSFHPMKIKSILFAIAGLALISPAHASITISGDPTYGTGVFSIDQDITFNITANSTADMLVFKSFVPSVDEWTMSALTGDFRFELNGSSFTREAGNLNDNGYSGNDIALNDGFVWWRAPFSVSAGDTLTIKADSFSMAFGTIEFNPGAIRSFSGNLIIVNQAGTQISNVVPEPSAFALLGLGTVGLVARRRRSA